MSENKFPNLNKEQQEAVNCVNGNLLIIASAGTGKTTTIVERYVNLIKNHDYKPNEVLMTTFTNKAAKDMVKKIVKRTGVEPPYVGTMHSLFLKILRAYAQTIGINPNFTIVEDDKKKIMREILKKDNINQKKDNINYFLKWIGKFKNRGILSENLSEDLSIDDIKEEGIIEEALDDDIIHIDPQLRKKVNKIYKEYDSELRKQNLMDFDDVLLFTFKLLNSNKELRESYSKKFKAIMIDEAQDLNKVQIDIIGLIQNDNLCIIGDDCQDIFGWRGSSPELVFSFNENQKKITLKNNYRSGKKIISSVNKVINSLKFKIDKKLICTKNTQGEVLISDFLNFQEEINYLTSEIKKLISNGTSKEDISVLFRVNNIGKEVERALKKNKIPCHLSKSVNFIEREEIKAIMSFMRLKINPYNFSDFERVLTLMDGFGKTTAKKFEDIAIKKSCSLIEVLKLHGDIKLNQKKLSELNKFIKLVTSYEKNPIEQFINDFSYLLKLNEKYTEDKDKLSDKLENIETLKVLFEGYGSSRRDIQDFLDGLIEIDKKEKTRDRITLSTIHSAKGLEWKHVFLISCNEGMIPFYRGKLESAKRESELKLFYVAISRAMDSIRISSSHEQWGREHERSNFIEIIE